MLLRGSVEHARSQLRGVIRLAGAIRDMHGEWIAAMASTLPEGSLAKLDDSSDARDLAAIGSGE